MQDYCLINQPKIHNNAVSITQYKTLDNTAQMYSEWYFQ